MGTPRAVTELQRMMWPFLKQARDTFGDRWVFSFNFYSIWDSHLMHKTYYDCHAAVQKATGVDYIKHVTRFIRGKISNMFVSDTQQLISDLTGSDDYKLWLTEVGWSSPGIIESRQRD